MIYIHSYKDFTQKNVEIESVPLLREIRSNFTLPIREEDLAFLSEAFPTREEISSLDTLDQKIQHTLAILAHAHADTRELYEPLNLERTAIVLSSIQGALSASKHYFSELFVHSQETVHIFTDSLMRLRQVVTTEEKNAVNSALSNCFHQLLRTDGLQFFAQDILNDTHTGGIKGIVEALNGGFLIRVLVEEHVAKSSWQRIRERVPQDILAVHDQITQNCQEIQLIVDAYYDRVMRVLYLAVCLYTFIKWLR
jgi:hypothetical protein